MVCTKMVAERKLLATRGTDCPTASLSQDILKVAALTQGGYLPSDRFRIRQNIPYLRKYGIEIDEFSPFLPQYTRLPGRLGDIRERYMLPYALVKLMLSCVGRVPGAIASHRTDLTWIGRTFITGFEGLVRFVRGPRVLDVDDAIWLTTPFGQRAAARFAMKMDAVIASNSFIADWYSQYCKSVYVVPGGIDTNRFKPADNGPKADADDFLIGWTGTSVNFHELYEIESVLASFLHDHPNTRLRIISNAPPRFTRIPSDRFEFRRWTADTEGSDLNDLDMGIMPLRETEWAKGKNSNKMLCYMASGLPVVVSPVGTNAEILRMGNIGFGPVSGDDWYVCLSSLLNDRSACIEMGAAGRTVVEREFSNAVISTKLARVFREMAR